MKTYLVGGAVRDKLLGYPHHEQDWVVVGATPEEMLRQGFKPVGKDFPVFLHPKTNEEYALARTERKTAPGYHGFACHSDPSVTLEEDLLRRDLTINAMAEDTQGHLIDPYGGRRDLDAKILRHVSIAFAEDPLRILRTARFAARYQHLEFHVAPETLELMRNMVTSGEVDALVIERVWKELQRALLEPNPEAFFFVLRDCGALNRLLPELTAVTEATWQPLAASAAQAASDTVRFAMLTAELDSAATLALSERLKAPNTFRELAILVSAWKHDLDALDTPSAALELLEKTDSLRRSDRFNEWLQACLILGTPPQNIERMTNAFQCANHVKAQTYLAQGITGTALGAALQQGRLAAIEQNWH